MHPQYKQNYWNVELSTAQSSLIQSPCTIKLVKGREVLNPHRFLHPSSSTSTFLPSSFLFHSAYLISFSAISTTSTNPISYRKGSASAITKAWLFIVSISTSIQASSIQAWNQEYLIAWRPLISKLLRRNESIYQHTIVHFYSKCTKSSMVRTWSLHWYIHYL